MAEYMAANDPEPANDAYAPQKAKAQKRRNMRRYVVVPFGRLWIGILNRNCHSKYLKITHNTALINEVCSIGMEDG